VIVSIVAFINFGFSQWTSSGSKFIWCCLKWKRLACDQILTA